MPKYLVMLLREVAQLREQKTVTDADWQVFLDLIETLDALAFSCQRLKKLGDNTPPRRLIRLQQLVRSLHLNLLEFVSRVLSK